jgi:hypothetical protein
MAASGESRRNTNKTGATQIKDEQQMKKKQRRPIARRNPINANRRADLTAKLGLLWGGSAVPPRENNRRQSP